MKSKKGCWEFLPHTADAKFRAYGKSLGECFRNAAKATFAIITDVEAVKDALRFPISITASKKEAVLFDFLDQLLFLLDTEGFILHDCKKMHVTETAGKWTVECDAIGDHHKEYDVAGNVKAVTYNEMYIKKLDDDRWECQVVVDL